MNELAQTTNKISMCQRSEVAAQIMLMCRAVTPQFFKNLSDADIKAEKMGIEMLTTGIEQPCLAEMCRRAVLNYPRIRSENPKQFFDINYILTFYCEAFNHLFCESVELPKKSFRLGFVYDRSSKILTEIWQTPTGEKVEIREIVENSKERSKVCSSKFCKTMTLGLEDLDEIEL